MKRIIPLLLYASLGAVLILFIYSLYYYFGRNQFQSLARESKSMNFLIGGLDKNGNADVVFLAHLNPQTAQLGFVFLHPELRLEEDSTILAKDFNSTLGSSFASEMEEITSQSIHFKVSFPIRHLERAINLLEGLRFFTRGESKDYLNHLIIPADRFHELDGDTFTRLSRYLKTNDIDGRLERMYRHQSMLLALFGQKSKYSKILTDEIVFSLATSFISSSPAISPGELQSLRDFLFDEKISTSVTYIPMRKIKGEKGQADQLVLLKKNAAIHMTKFLKKIDTINGLFIDANFKSMIYNAASTNSDGLGRRVALRLKNHGIFSYQPQNYPGGYLNETVILDHSGNPGFAKQIARKLGVPQSWISEEIDPSKGVTIDTEIILGENYPRKKK